MVFGYTLLHGVCDVPPNRSTWSPHRRSDVRTRNRPRAYPRPLTSTSSRPLTSTSPRVSPSPVPEVSPSPVPEVVQAPVPEVTPEAVPAAVLSKVNIPPAPPSTPECDMPLVAKPSSTSINDGIKEIYSNNMIQHKFAKIYESIDKIKSNSALVMDLIQEFKLMRKRRASTWPPLFLI